MTNEEYESAVARADDFLDTLKDTCHDQYDKIKELEQYNMKLKDKVEVLQDRIDKAIQTIEKNENKAPIEVILNDIGEALDILKGKE